MWLCSSCSRPRSIAEARSGRTHCSFRKCQSGRYRPPRQSGDLNDGGKLSGEYTDYTTTMMWVPKAECPKCHTQQSFDEYNRGIARCQLCEVRYFHKFEIDEFIPYTKQFHEKFALFDPLRSFKLSPLHFSSVLFAIPRR